MRVVYPKYKKKTDFEKKKKKKLAEFMFLSSRIIYVSNFLFFEKKLEESGLN